MYSPPNTTVGKVQSAVSEHPQGPFTIVNPDVQLAHKAFTSAELFVDHDVGTPAHGSGAAATAAAAAAAVDQAYIVYSSVHPGHQAASVIELLDANWTSSAGTNSGPFGAGEGQVVFKWSSPPVAPPAGARGDPAGVSRTAATPAAAGSPPLHQKEEEGAVQPPWYYMLQGSTPGCCFCPGGSNSVAYRARAPLGPYTFLGNINPCIGGQPIPAPDQGSCTAPAPPNPTLGVGPIYGSGLLCLAPNTSAECVPHGGEIPAAAALCGVRLVPCVTGAAEQAWRVTGAGELVSNATGACLDAGHAATGQAVYTNDCVRTAADPAPIGQTWLWKDTAADGGGGGGGSAGGALVNRAARSCLAFQPVPGAALRMAGCGQPDTTAVWHLPAHGGGGGGNGPSPGPRAWEVPAQQQGVTDVAPLRLQGGTAGACAGGTMIWSGDGWQQAADSQKAHDPQWWVPLCFDQHGNIGNLTALGSFELG